MRSLLESNQNMKSEFDSLNRTAYITRKWFVRKNSRTNVA